MAGALEADAVALACCTGGVVTVVLGSDFLRCWAVAHRVNTADGYGPGDVARGGGLMHCGAACPFGVSAPSAVGDPDRTAAVGGAVEHIEGVRCT